MSDICVLLPTYNEAESVGKVIDEIPMGQLKALGHNAYIVLADGNSTDETATIAFGKGVSVFCCPRGKGNGVRHALGLVKPDYLFMLDADFTYPANDIVAMLAMLESNSYDVVSGKRLFQDGTISLAHLIGNRLLTIFANTLYRTKTEDLCTGIWGFTNKALGKIELTAEGFDLEANLFTEINKKGLKFGQIPIYYRAREGTKSKLSAVKDGFSIAKKLVIERLKR